MSSLTPASVSPNNSRGPFEEFFELGLQETVSPFLTPDSRAWGAHLTLKAACLAAVLLLASFVSSFFPEATPLSRLLLIGVYFFAGIPSLIEAIEDLSNGEINIDILMTLAAFSSVFIGSGLEGGLLLVLFALSGAMEDAVTAKAKGAISSLTKLSPTRACVVESDGTLIERAIRDVSIGQTILVRAGQMVPLDGVVKAGISSVNLVHLTGENMPVTKGVGDSVPAGGRNLEGTLTLEVERTSADSTLAKIIELVTQAQEAKPVLQRWFDKLSQAYATTIILLSAFFALALPFVLSIPFLGMEGSLYRALAFLIAASPCALIIAIPIAYLSAVSVCARKGVLLKGGMILDALAGCRTMAFDKTGTLTTGNLNCLGVEALEAVDQAAIPQAVAIAFALEKNALHPIAQAIVSYGMEQKAPVMEIVDFRAIAGYGLEGIVSRDGKRVETYVGRPSYIAEKLPEGIKQPLIARVSAIESTGELIAVLVVDKRPFIFRFRDTLRPHITETVAAIKKRGWETVMLTGDHLQNARKIAAEVGVDKFFADLTPEDKLIHVTQIAEQTHLAMVGDGINDAPALARATVGICMGKVGSTAAIDAADVVLLRDDIDMLNWLIGKAVKTQRIVKQNLALAVGAIFLASLPALAGLVPLWLAVVMHEGGTVLVGLNALRLLRD